MPIRAVFFDAGDTLIHRWALKAERFAWLCRNAGIALPADPALLSAGARAHERYFQDRRKHQDAWSPTWNLRLNRTGLEALGLTAAADDLAARILAAAREAPRTTIVDPDVPPMLEYLRAKGYRLAIISNWDGTLVECLRQTGLGGYFDAVLDSDVVGARKPAPRMFEVACAATGVRPDEAVHIGDSPCADVAGAQAAGVRPLLLDALDLFGDGYDDLPPFARLQRLADLPAWLEAQA